MFGDDLDRRQQQLSRATAHHLIPRPGTAAAVAAALVFLIKNDFVTGTTVEGAGGCVRVLSPAVTGPPGLTRGADG